MRVTVLFNKLFSFINSMGPSGWAIVAVLLVGFGIFCMRGYGSRDNY